MKFNNPGPTLCILLAGLAFFAACSASDRNYTAVVILEFPEFERNPDVNYVRQSSDDRLSVLKNRLQRDSVTQAVADRLDTESLATAFLRPYTSKSIQQVLQQNRDVEVFPELLHLHIRYTHPNREIALSVANFFAEEFLRLETEADRKSISWAIEDMETRINRQRNRIATIQEEIPDPPPTREAEPLAKAESLAELDLRILKVKETREGSSESLRQAIASKEAQIASLRERRVLIDQEFHEVEKSLHVQRSILETLIHSRTRLQERLANPEERWPFRIKYKAFIAP